MIIITAPVHESFLLCLEENNLSYLYWPHINLEDLLPLMPQASGLVVATHITVNQPLIDQAPHLKWIGRLGSGMEHIDVDYAAQKGIQCYSSPEGNSNAVAEMALGSLLNLLRNISKSSAEVEKLQWKREENRGVEISGKTIGIIGYGNTGSRFAQLLSSFGCRLLVYDKYKSELNDENIHPCNLETILHEAEVISLHLPLNNETHHLVNAVFFSSLRQKPFLINTSRGGIVHTAALIEALQLGQISGAVLDVLENEKLQQLSDEEKQQLTFLNEHPTVIITPHIAGYTRESFIRLGSVLLEKLGLTL
jgi:D-3-phosphoglycerate dehydrogenase